MILIHLMQVIEPITHWPQRLLSLMQTLDPELIKDMGVPYDWQARPIWQGLVTAGDAQ